MVKSLRDYAKSKKGICYVLGKKKGKSLEYVRVLFVGL